MYRFTERWAKEKKEGCPTYSLSVLRSTHLGSRKVCHQETSGNPFAWKKHFGNRAQKQQKWGTSPDPRVANCPNAMPLCNIELATFVLCHACLCNYMCKCAFMALRIVSLGFFPHFTFTASLGGKLKYDDYLCHNWGSIEAQQRFEVSHVQMWHNPATYTDPARNYSKLHLFPSPSKSCKNIIQTQSGVYLENLVFLPSPPD